MSDAELEEKFRHNPGIPGFGYRAGAAITATWALASALDVSRLMATLG